MAFCVANPIFAPSRLAPIRTCASRRNAPKAARPRPRTVRVCAPPPEEPQGNSYHETTLIPETVALDPSSGSTVVQASYHLPGAFLGAAALARLADLPALWVPLGVLGLFLTVQAANVRFVFGPERLSVTRKGGGELKIIRGWRYAEFAHWEVWWAPFAVLCYFRERESYGGRGSIHFFPVVCDGAVLRAKLQEKCPKADE